MSTPRGDIQSAEGVFCNAPGGGILGIAQTVAPTNGAVGYAPGCTWINFAASGSGFKYTNIGSFTSATWVEDDPGFGQQAQFGGGTSYMGTSGNLYRTILPTASGIVPSATGALKIVDIYTLSAKSLNAAGQGLQFTVWANNAGTSGHAVRMQIVANPSNSGLPASGAGVAGKTDGTVTVTGGTVILDTGASYSPTGTVTFGMSIVGQLFKTGASGSNTQESLLTAVLPSAGLTHTSAWADQTLTESAAIVFAVVTSAATTATDITYQGCEITAFN